QGQTDPPCTVLDRIVASAGDNFSTMRGRLLDQFEGDATYELNAFLPGAATCKLIELDGSGVVDCLYRYESQQAAADGSRLIDRWIARCAGAQSFHQAGRYKGPDQKVRFSRSLNNRGDYRLRIRPAAG
ncbi:MAG: hypothetical protein WCY32_07550, partial [Burkholderiaceae bacterium]